MLCNFVTYTGATTLSGGDRTLTGSTVNFGAAVTGTTSHDLIITGNLDLDGALTSVVDLSVSGTSNLGANVTTSGTQTYTGATTLSGGDRTLTGSTMNFGSTLTGTGSHDLIITGKWIRLLSKCIKSRPGCRIRMPRRDSIFNGVD